MKKIAMITFHASHNNGSMLQALALQTALQQRNCDIEIIDFSNEGQRNLYSVLPYPHNFVLHLSTLHVLSCKIFFLIYSALFFFPFNVY